ncbi:MAG: hypothetical protein E6Q44_16910 [Flavobacteriales bacterium]|jgi:hypothetical protein|nr:MAG: hypothetical protein E6Q44_16910 [Flavobacteriales bacterium]
MDLKRRLQLYLVGLVIGGVAAYFFYGDRLTNAAWTPEEKIKQRLRSTLIQAAPEAQRALQERALQLADVRAAVDRATIDLGRTVRTSDTLYYAVDTDLKGENVRLIVVGLRDFDRDSTATLWRIEQRQ